MESGDRELFAKGGRSPGRPRVEIDYGVVFPVRIHQVADILALWLPDSWLVNFSLNAT
jgi:hypothetical protein